MSNLSKQPQTVHFAPSEKAERQQNVMCGYIAPDDGVTRDPGQVTCPDCRDWIEAPTEAIGAGVTGHD